MFNESKLANQNGSSATVSIKDWLLLDLISLLNIIPLVGTIICLIIYAVIAFGSSSAPSMKNRILANLAWFVIGFVVLLVYLFVFGGIAAISSIIDSATA